MNQIALVTDQWPIAVTTVTGELQEENLDGYFEAFKTKVLQRGQPFVSVVDATALTVVPNSRVRHRIGIWERENAALGEHLSLGIAIVTTSSLVRGAMVAINWIHPPKVKTVYEARLDDAMAWARRQLAENAA